MTQQRHEYKGRKNIKKLLAELASRQSDWREEKTKEIKMSQKYGLNVSASIRIDFSKNNKDLPVVKSTNISAKHIQVKPQTILNKQLLNLSDLDHNGDSCIVKRSKTVKRTTKRPYFNTIVAIQDENQPPKNEKQFILPKINVDLRKKTSLDFLKSDTIERQRGLDSQQLQIIEQQQLSVLKRVKETYHKLRNKVVY